MVSRRWWTALAVAGRQTHFLTLPAHELLFWESPELWWLWRGAFMKAGRGLFWEPVGWSVNVASTTRSPLDLFLSVSLIKTSIHPSIVRAGPPCAHWNSSLTYSIKLVPTSLKIHLYAMLGGLFQGLWSFPRGSDFPAVVVDYCGSTVKIEPHNRTVRQQNFLHESILFRNMGGFFLLLFFSPIRWF